MRTLLLLFVMIFSLTSCYTFKMDIGKGAPKKNTQTIHKKEWYLLWGIAPLNTVDAKKMAKGAANYTIKSQVNVLDILLGLPTLYFLRSQTVNVKKQFTPKVAKAKKQLVIKKTMTPPSIDSTRHNNIK